MLHQFRTICALLLLISLLGGCDLQGGVQPTPVAPVPTVVIETPSFQPVRGMRIALTVEPGDLYPYSGSPDSAAVLALLYPPPIVALSSGYTTTGVLAQLPSSEDGTMVEQTVELFLDESGVITTTQTELVTQATQLVVTYRWSPDLRWSDGRPLTAEDSLFAYELARADALNPALSHRLELTERYEVVDAHTTRAYLRPQRPGTSEPDYLLTAWLPLPRHVLEGLDSQAVARKLNDQPLGYGPYTLEERLPGELRLTRRGDAPRSYPPEVTFLIVSDLAELRDGLLAGAIDVGVTEQIVPEQFPFIEQDRDNGLLQLHVAPGPVWERLDFNLDLAPFDDPRIRQGFAHAINRAALVERFYAGHVPVMHSWIGPDSWASAQDQVNRYDYDPQRASQLFDEAGLLDYDGDGLRELAPGTIFTATLLTSSGTPMREEVAASIRDDLGALGVSLTLELMSLDELYHRDGPLFHRSFQLALFGALRTPDPDGGVLWSCAAIPGPQNGWTNNNFAGWCSLEGDRLLREALATNDPARRLAPYREHQRIFAESLPGLPLFTRPLVALSVPQLRGLMLDGFAPITWNFGEWRLD